MNDDGERRGEARGHRVLEYRRAGGGDVEPALAPDDPRRIDAEIRRRHHPALGWLRFGHGLMWVGGAGFIIGYVMTGGKYNRDYRSARGQWGFVIAMVSFVVACAGGLIVSNLRKRVTRERGRRDGPGAG